MTLVRSQVAILEGQHRVMKYYDLDCCTDHELLTTPGERKKRPPFVCV
jgi:hypothetical protein